MAGIVAIVAAASAMATATATATATASSTPSATASAAPASMKPPSGGDCELLGSFALVVQAGLGGLALLSLVYKRWRERPQRPLKIWFFDVSKQVFGSVLVHVANIFMSMLTSGRFSVQMEPVVVGGSATAATATAAAAAALARRWLTGRDDGGGDDEYKPNPCSFYLLNLGIDTTLGIPILIGLLKLFTMLAAYTPLGKPRESIQSGYYGNPPNAWWWLKQSLIYFVGLFCMKVVVLLMFLVFPGLSHIGDWALRWTEGNEQLQIVFVMMLFPLIMNALQYYIIDSFIKEKASPHAHHERLPDEDPDWPSSSAAAAARNEAVDSGLYDDETVLLESESESDDDDDVDDDADRRIGAAASRRRRSEDETGWKMAPQRPHNKNHRAEGGEEYDPDLDGDAPTVVGSSNTSSQRRGSKTSLGPVLYPKE
ncbi:hypothetical protein SODALDRAFT_209381 [Sodiomyces alkalinus F11]|uniref:Vacuolar membrane protein n=1 Tax=Sodiomyces alkalinus (strain CBS 110278 / VKM F-3762 / F11) TaxID=1314773 RepID=A0A3N2PRA3_SODAK|nr:hypothetical protein SODALDRAFT_209381 [Sodiomyces alkalinus F11]ROT36876.1 hypothetical protein SODALDRAFT_209381 [Sodiomyces alkalinus F11]